ncbi:MAG: 30S ribosomal protein S13 [Nanoarchaeota archaeon]|nr:30S ribosomal protein S13 [Nanoarchaeota archaeon]
MAKKENKSAELIRIMATDIPANHSLLFGLSKIKGVGVMFSNAVCIALGIDKNKKIGMLSEKEIEVIENYLNAGDFSKIPTWMLNQQKDVLTGENKHFVSKDLDFQTLQLQRRMSKIRSYRVLRSKLRLTVRGQRTASNFRRNRMLASKKSKTGGKK